jgi:glycosyltransferase involved in cell wall biosynthesis
VSVVVPFRGDRAGAERLRRALCRLRLDPDDELIVADNTDDGTALVAAGAHSPVHVVRATEERSSYHARNVGAGAARGEWLAFTDADCAPTPGLLDAFFAEPVAERCGALAGEVVGEPDQEGFLPRYARSRNLLSQTRGLFGRGSGVAATANLIVRRSAFGEVGGFAQGIRSGGDIDLCRRLGAAGWTLEYRPAAIVVHSHREGLVPFLGAIARYAAGARWLNERYPGSAPRWPLVHGIAGSARDVAANALRGRFEAALFRGIDALGLVAHNVGYVTSNEARR